MKKRYSFMFGTLILMGIIFIFLYVSYLKGIPINNLDDSTNEILEVLEAEGQEIEIKEVNSNMDFFIRNPLTNVNPRRSFLNSSNSEVAYIDHEGHIGGLGNVTFNNSDNGYGFFNYLGSQARRITKIWATDIDVSGTVNTTNLNATNVYQDGSIVAINSSLISYLLATDQRYNETDLINSVNTTGNIQLLLNGTNINFLDINSSTGSIFNLTFLQQGAGIVDYEIKTRGDALAIVDLKNNRASILELFSNEGNNEDDVLMKFYANGTYEDITNAETLRMGYSSTSGDFILSTNIIGSGKDRNLSINTNGNAKQIYIRHDNLLEFNSEIVDIVARDFQVLGSAGSTTRDLEWINPDATTSYLNISDVIKIGELGGVTGIEATDGANDNLHLKTPGTGVPFVGGTDFNGGFAFYESGGYTTRADIKGYTTDLRITSASGKINFDNENVWTTGSFVIDTDTNGLLLGASQDVLFNYGGTKTVLSGEVANSGIFEITLEGLVLNPEEPPTDTDGKDTIFNIQDGSDYDDVDGFDGGTFIFNLADGGTGDVLFGVGGDAGNLTINPGTKGTGSTVGAESYFNVFMNITMKNETGQLHTCAVLGGTFTCNPL